MLALEGEGSPSRAARRACGRTPGGGQGRQPPAPRGRSSTGEREEGREVGGGEQEGEGGGAGDQGGEATKEALSRARKTALPRRG